MVPGLFCAWFSLAQLPTDIAREFFLDPVFSKRNGFIFLLPSSRICSMPRQDFFVPYHLPSHVKYYVNSQNFPTFKKKKKKKFSCNDDVNRASAL